MSKLSYIIFFILIYCLSTLLTIRFLVRSGNDVLVPSLVGLTFKEAQAIVSERKLGISVKGTMFSESIPEGNILRQSIGPEEKVREGRTVSVYLSKGLKERSISRLIGLDIEVAIKILESSKINYEIAKSCSETTPMGIVISQNPSPGSPMAGQKLSLLISNGKCLSRISSKMKS